jgi:hypothetical protein
MTLYCDTCHRPTPISDSHDDGWDDMGRERTICTPCKAARPRRWTDGPAVRNWMAKES